MIDNLLDPAVLFFGMGILASLLKSDLRLPEPLYETLSIYLLLAIGLKGGVELSTIPLSQVFVPVLGTLALGLIIPAIAYFLLRVSKKFSQPDAAALAAHYGSVSAVTFAVVLNYLSIRQEFVEPFSAVLLVVLEVPAIAMGIFIAKYKMSDGPLDLPPLLHEVFLGRSIFLLIGGLAVGYFAGETRMESITPLFSNLFKGALAIFLLEMGIVAARRLSGLKETGAALVIFAICMPLISAVLGIGVGILVGLGVGGTTVLATLSASASYIAAPAAVRIAIPQANPTLYLTASLGITFPFNIAIGIPIFYYLSNWFHQM